jgi:hypothetical protein
MFIISLGITPPTLHFPKKNRAGKSMVLSTLVIHALKYRLIAAMLSEV